MLAVLPGDAAFSHWTAASLLGLPSRDCAKLHVLLGPRRVLPQRAELLVHGRTVEEGDVVRTTGLPVTSGSRTYVDLAEYLRIPELVILGDAVLRAGFTDPFSLAARVQAAAGRRGIKRARDALELLDAGAQSVPESLIRYHLMSSDLPKPTTQLPVCNAKGIVVAHADLGYEEWRVLIEYEGRQHSEGDQFGRDIERYSRMAADGWTVLRFSSVHLRTPWLIVERVRASLTARGWRPRDSNQPPK